MQKEDSKFGGQKLTLYIFECLMSLLYLFISYVLIFTEYLSDSLNDKIRLPLGILMGAYGIFRVYRAIRKFLTRDAEK